MELGKSVQKNKGFTLIELMVTIAVLGIIATIAAPSFIEIIRKNELNQETQHLIFLLQEARSDAIFTRSSKQIKIPTYGSDEKRFSEWSVTNDMSSLEFTAMGYLNSNTSICLTLTHKKNSHLSSSIRVEKNGAISKDTSNCLTN
ncbi:prepilin-type N-terminal cleavage/methylation domain-containing protein [Acinetobacter variabilis]|uniref:Prepilin-type N-terminal cleavage/methylation domain-containing protein n=1 Tax=Acinetobacter variabilis TaxID=70346 RepID=A0A7T8AQM2_9GAMM|nr:prepilin-type N-terminal cleavage/methylation domain-containing protein [Acinetobacter sp. YH12233]QQN87819.1 prepilin-type N-terminal cleavage/methylation domain-containing protein [Acinetobacter variabilis]